MEHLKIDLNNYEEHIINYLDGNLSPVEVAELFLFFKNHPELDENLDELRMIKVEANTEYEFGFTEVLKIDHDLDGQEISNDNYLYYFVAYIEKNLTPKGIEAVNGFIQQHPETVKELEQLKLTIAQPPVHIVFPDKSVLKRKTGMVMPVRLQWAAIAASILILFSVYLRLNPLSEESLNETLGGYEIPATEVKPEQIGSKDKTEEKNIQPKSSSTTDTHTKTKVAQKSTGTESGKTESRIDSRPVNSMPSIKPTINRAQPFEGKTRNDYTSLYEDIRLSQELMLAYEESRNETTSASDEFQTIKLGRRFNQYLRSGAQIATQIPGSLSGWLVADLGVKGFNLLTDNELKLVRQANADGTTGNVTIVDGELSYPLRRSSL